MAYPLPGRDYPKHYPCGCDDRSKNDDPNSQAEIVHWLSPLESLYYHYCTFTYLIHHDHKDDYSYRPECSKGIPHRIVLSQDKPHRASAYRAIARSVTQRSRSSSMSHLLSSVRLSFSAISFPLFNFLPFSRLDNRRTRQAG